MMSAGRSKDGRWDGASHHSTGMYRLHPGRNENAYNDGTNWREDFYSHLWVKDGLRAAARAGLAFGEHRAKVSVSFGSGVDTPPVSVTSPNGGVELTAGPSGYP